MKKKYYPIFLSINIFFMCLSKLNGTTVNTWADLETAIKNINNGASIPLITFNSDITYSQITRPLSVKESFGNTNVGFTIEGNGKEFHNTGAARGFMALGDVTTSHKINNLKFIDSSAKGGDGGISSGGGGAGVGGALFIQKGVTLTIENIDFQECLAIGGNGAEFLKNTGGGGGGGLHGNGGESPINSSSGGGGGAFFLGQGGNSEGIYAGGGSGSGGSGFDGNSLALSAGKGGDGFDGTGGGTVPGGNGTGGGGGGGGDSVNPNGGIASDTGGGGGGGSLQVGTPGGGKGNRFGGGGGSGAGNDVFGGPGGDYGGGGGASYPPFIGYPSPGPFGTGGQGGIFAGGGGGYSGAGTSTLEGGEGGFKAGGGGAGCGGAIFIEGNQVNQKGGTLIMKGSHSFVGCNVEGGLGFNPGNAKGQEIYMGSGGLIRTQLSGDTTVPHPIESNKMQGPWNNPKGGLIVENDPGVTLRLNGDQTYTGQTRIDSGTLHVEGSLITDVTVNGGIFGGNVTVKNDPSVLSNGDVTVNGGQLSPGGDGLFGFMSIEGNLSIANSATFHDIEVDSASNTDFISVDGTAQIDGTLAVDAFHGNFLQGQVITILEAGGGVNGTFSSNLLPTFPGTGNPLFGVVYNPNSVDLEVLENILFGVVTPGGPLTTSQISILEQTINPGNPLNVAEYLFTLLPINPTSNLGIVIEKLGLLSNKEVNRVLNIMSGSIFGSLEWINLTNNAQALNVFSQRLSGLSCSKRGCSPLSCCNDLNAAEENHTQANNLYVQPFFIWNNQNQIGQLIGMNASSQGVMIGYDRCLKSQFLVGCGVGYTHTDFKWNESAGSGKIQQVYGGLYGTYSNCFINLNLSTMVGENFYDLKRKIAFNSPSRPNSSVNESAHSHYNGFEWTSRFGIIGSLKKLSIPLQVLANVDYFYLNQNRFQESGATGINLDVREKVSNMLQTETGMTYIPTFSFDGGCLSPYLGLSYLAKIPLSSSIYRANFINQSGTFTSNTTSKAINFVVPYLGLKAMKDDGFSFLLNAKAELSGYIKDYVVDCRFDYSF